LTKNPIFYIINVIERERNKIFMTNMSMNGELPSFFEQLVHHPGARVLIMTKLSQKDILDFYKYVVSKEGEIYKEVARELEEELVIQHYLNGTLPEEQIVIEDSVRIIEERRKQRNNLAYRLYRKVVPFENKNINRL